MNERERTGEIQLAAQIIGRKRWIVIAFLMHSRSGENLGGGNRRGRDTSQSDLEDFDRSDRDKRRATGSAARLRNAVVAVPATTA